MCFDLTPDLGCINTSTATPDIHYKSASHTLLKHFTSHLTVNEKMGSSAVLLFTAAALLLVLAELGQSAPAQDQLSGPQREAIQNYYQQFARAQEQNYRERLAQIQTHGYPEQPMAKEQGVKLMVERADGVFLCILYFLELYSTLLVSVGCSGRPCVIGTCCARSVCITPIPFVPFVGFCI